MLGRRHGRESRGARVIGGGVVGTAPPTRAAGVSGTTADSGELLEVAFRWQDANYGRDSALGRELLFLIADNGWSRATTERISVTRSDSLETSIEVDIDLDRVTHEAFRGRTGRIWLPILVLPPLRQSPESDPQSALAVMDAAGTPQATLADADVTHRIAAAITEIIVNMAVPRLPDSGNGHLSSIRAQRLMLSAAVYRLLRGDHVRRIGRARRDVGDLLEYFAGLLTPAQSSGPDDAAGTRRLTERATRVLLAFAESTVVVVAAELGHSPATLTVTVPSRALHLALPGAVEAPGFLALAVSRALELDPAQGPSADRPAAALRRSGPPGSGEPAGRGRARPVTAAFGAGRARDQDPAATADMAAQAACLSARQCVAVAHAAVPEPRRPDPG